MNKKSALAYKALNDSIRAIGSNCLGREEELSGENLPTMERARAVCWRCPLAGDRGLCSAYAEAERGKLHGVYNGKVYDYWKDLDKED